MLSSPPLHPPLFFPACIVHLDCYDILIEFHSMSKKESLQTTGRTLSNYTRFPEASSKLRNWLLNQLRAATLLPSAEKQAPTIRGCIGAFPTSFLFTRVAALFLSKSILEYYPGMIRLCIAMKMSRHEESVVPWRPVMHSIAPNEIGSQRSWVN